MEFVSPEYEAQLQDLAERLVTPARFAIRAAEDDGQPAFDFPPEQPS